jgi:cytoskeletal protein RodZ
MTVQKHKSENGVVNQSLIITISLIVLVVITSSLAVWAFVSYREEKTNVEGKKDLAVATAKKEQADSDEEKFAQREKEPQRQFAGPDDYGRLMFNYPKTWSVYEASSTSERGNYQAYLNPIIVPSVSDEQQYALRVTIEQKDYDQVVKSYESLVKKGDLRSSAVTTNGHNGTRLDGNFSKDIRGSAVIFKIRDKTVTLRTDADTFKTDFDTLIKTIDFNS